MTLDIKGGRKNTAVSSNKYVVLEELVSNSIDSYLIRRDAKPIGIPELLITLNVEIFSASLIEGDYDLKISCTDNGAGFGKEQVKAFVTKDTSYKDYLKIIGIGKCKGAGRIQFFHYFNNLKVDSIYADVDGNKRATLNIYSDAREITESQFLINDVRDEKLTTTISLSNISTDIASSKIDKRNILLDFSTEALESDLYRVFLQRFIILKKIIGKFSIKINGKFGEKLSSKNIHSDDLPVPVSEKLLKLSCHHENKDTNNKEYQLKVTRYSFPVSKIEISQHEVALCANSAIVHSLSKQFLRSAHDRSRAINEHFELLLVESDFLEDKVNEPRDGFDIPKECTQNGSFENEISYEDIIDSLEDYVYEILTPPEFDKNKLIKETQNKFGISKSMLEQTNIKIHFGDTEENIAKRVLKKYQEEIVDETSDIYNMKEHLLKLDPRSDDFRDKVNEISWKYTDTIKKVDMANLSQLVVRRTAMVEVLKHAVKRVLDCQTNSEDARRDDERIIHNIFFPTKKDNTKSIDHDIWILNEEYHYFEHIISEKPLASFKWNDGTNLFDSDIDENLKELFQKNNKILNNKRPDIAIFNNEGSAIIIEFKSPDVPLQDHIPDLIQYSRLLAAKSNGKIKKFYGYLIGNTIDETRMPGEFKPFPSGLGYFSTTTISENKSGRVYGELYSEVLFYNQFIDRADKRLNVYKKKLNIGF
jgi:hypothetical protein